MMKETEENRMEIEAKERAVFDESRYYGDEGRGVLDDSSLNLLIKQNCQSLLADLS